MARMQLEYVRDKLEALKELIEHVAPDVSRPLKAKLCKEGNEKNEDYELIKKFLVWFNLLNYIED